MTGSVRVIMNVPDRAVAEAFARATYPRLAAHAESEAPLNGGGVAAARFSLCAVAFAAAATDATARSVRASRENDDTNASRENDASIASRRRFHKLAVMKYAKDLARAASAALRDGAAAPEARVAAAGLATAMLARTTTRWRRSRGPARWTTCAQRWRWPRARRTCHRWRTQPEGCSRRWARESRARRTSTVFFSSRANERVRRKTVFDKEC